MNEDSVLGSANGASVLWKSNGAFDFWAPDQHIRGWASTGQELTRAIEGWASPSHAQHIPSGWDKVTKEIDQDERWEALWVALLDVEELRLKLAGSSPQLDEVTGALTQVRARVASDRRSIAEQLSESFALLQEHCPQTGEIGARYLIDETIYARSYEWVQTSAIVDTQDEVWGDFGSRRPEMLHRVTKALVEADSPSLIRSWVFKFSGIGYDGPIRLLRFEGPGGPIYEVGSGGSHRTHLARALGIPIVLAEVVRYPAVESISVLDVPYEQEVEFTETAAHLERLGFLQRIDSRDTTPKYVLGKLPAVWWLKTADEAARLNRAYEHAYPGALAHVQIKSNAAQNMQRWTYECRQAGRRKRPKTRITSSLLASWIGAKT